MANIGRVTVGSTTNLRTIRVNQQTQTSLASPTYGPRVNLALDDLSDVIIANPEQGYTLVYNSATNKFEVGPPGDVTIIRGGTF